MCVKQCHNTLGLENDQRIKTEYWVLMSQGQLQGEDVIEMKASSLCGLNVDKDGTETITTNFKTRLLTLSPHSCATRHESVKMWRLFDYHQARTLMLGRTSRNRLLQ